MLFRTMKMVGRVRVHSFFAVPVPCLIVFFVAHGLIQRVSSNEVPTASLGRHIALGFVVPLELLITLVRATIDLRFVMKVVIGWW